MMYRRTLLAAALAAPAFARAAEPWPNRPIRLIVGFAPGGATDLIMRAISPRLSQVIGQQIVVDNRPGAGGNLASEIVARSTPDGYTLLAATIGALAINPTLYRNLLFNPQVDLSPVGLVGNVLNILAVSAQQPWRNVSDLLAAARARPDTLTYGSSGIGGAGHLAGALLDNLAGISTVHVPYRGGGPMMNDLVSAKIAFSFATAPTVIPQVEGGRLRALGVPGTRRSPLLPEVQTVAETVPGFDVQNWTAVMGPKDMPGEIVAKLNAALAAAMNDAAVAPQLARAGVEAVQATPPELARFIREETAKWAPILRNAQIQAE
jgi:tripartite-type tricarboxylate transporter receptor subunit TctC